MLNLHPIFQDAIDVLSQYAMHLRLPALPATVYLMQQDVINHYRLAARHYLPLMLNEHFLQNSSIGNPYEKWAKVTNEDFDHLAFMVTNLIRYTTRLIHETESVALEAERRFTEASARSNAYISPLVEIDHKQRQIGIRINPDNTLALTPFSTEYSRSGTLRERTIPLLDRSVLNELQIEALAECDYLVRANDRFRVLCNSYYAEHEVAAAFDLLHQSWWL